jgi:hypothetical protein
MMRSMKQVVLVGAVGVVVVCTSAPTDALAASPSLVSLLHKQLVAALSECTGRYGYDPDQTAGVAENALAPNELPWRQCAYEAVRAYAKEHPSLGGLYTQLINEDITMTTAIQQGTLTRSERRARIEALLTQIRAAEDSQIEAADNQGKGGQNPNWSSQERNQLSNVVAGVGGFY